MSRTRTAFLFFVSVAMLSWAGFAVGCASAPAYEASCDIGSLPVEAPIVLVADGLPVVEMEIGGKKLRLIVDTGADKVSLGIKPSALDGVAVAYTGHYRKSRDINGKARTERFFEIPSATIGGLALRDIPGSEELRDFVPADGIIGNAFLSAFILLIDYPGSRIKLYPRGAELPELASGTWSEIRFRRGYAGLTVDCAWSGGGKGRFCLDTGASGLGVVHTGKLRPSDISREVEVPAAMGGTLSLATLKDFSLGGAPVGDLDCVAKDLGSVGPFGPPFAGVVGYGVLKGRRVIFDYSRMIVFLEAGQSFDR